MMDLEFLSHHSECVRIKHPQHLIRDFTGQDLLASFKKLELKQLLSRRFYMKIKLYPDLSNQNSRKIFSFYLTKTLVNKATRTTNTR